MPIFKNVFACSSQEKEEDDLKDRINRLEIKFDLIEREYQANFRSLSDRLDIKLTMLENKIDNLILVLNR